MLILVILLCVLLHFHTFYNIIWTNLLTQCPVPVSVCCCPCIAGKCQKKVLGKFQKNQIKNQCNRRLQKPEGRPEGGHPLPVGHLARPGVGPRPQAAWEEDTSPGAPLRPIFSPRSENPREQPRYAISSTVPTPPRFRSRDCQEKLSRHPAGGRIDLRRPLHHHDRLRDVP